MNDLEIIIASGLKYKVFEPTNSVLIKSICYSWFGDFNNEKMLIVFKDKSVIEYSSPIVLPPEEKFDMEKLYQDFIDSDSVGKFWHKHIKNKLQYKKII